MTTLFDPLTLGDLTLKNRVIMAPLTRARAIGGGRVPNALMAKYYEQRASAGLILSEATSVTPQGVGYEDTPGLWSDEQVAGWKLVTEAVHAAGGLIFAQLWHVGRISDPARAQRRGTGRRRRGLSPGRRKRQESRLRRRRSPWRQWLPARPVPARQQQPAQRQLRRLDRQPRSPDAGSDRRLHRRLGRRPRRHAPGTAPRLARHGRLDAGRDLRLRRARTGPPQDCLHLLARSAGQRQPWPAVEKGIRRRLHRQRKDGQGRRPAGTGRRRGRRGCLRQGLHLEPGPGAPFATGRAAQRLDT